MTHRHLLLFACFALLAIPTTATAAEPFKPFSGSKSVKTANLHMPLTEEPNYTDRYTLEAWFDNGERLWVSFLVRNFGPGGKGKMLVRSRHIEKGGKEFYSRHKLKKGQYQVSNGSPFKLTAAGHTLSGTPRSMTVSGKAKGHAFKVTFKSGLAPWRPGRVLFGVDQGKYLEANIVQPKAEVSGTVNGKKVKGYGYVLKTQSNIAPHHMTKRYLQVRSISGDTVVWMSYWVSSDVYGVKPFGYLYLARGGKVLATSTRYGLRMRKSKTDSKHKNRYKVPHELSTKLKRKGKKIMVKLVADKIIGREDVLKSLSGLERALVKNYAQPVNYTLSAKIGVAVQEGDADPVISEEKASYELGHLNK